MADASTKPGPEGPPPEFRLHFESKGGMPLGDGLYDWTTVLNMQGGGRPRASMLLNHHNGDLIGRPVGMFSDAVPLARARQVAKAFNTIMAMELPAPTGGDVSANMLRIEYQSGKRKFASSFNAMNREYLAAIGPVMVELEAVMVQLMAKPERAMVVAVERVADAGAEVKFQLRLTNVGTKELMVGHPQLPGKDANFPRAVVNVAPVPAKTPGVMEIPPRWKPVALEAAPAGTMDGGVSIKGGDSLVVTSVGWTAPKAGDYVVQGVWQDRGGATKADPTKLQTAIPKEAAPDDKVLMLRGAAFSKYVKVAIAPK